MIRPLLYAAATSLLLAACSSSVSDLANASPSAGACIRYIECEDGPAGCREEAQEVCGGAGYTPVDESSLGSAFPEFARRNFPGAASGVPHMVVTCNE